MEMYALSRKRGRKILGVSLWKMQQSEVSNDELLAYTIGKIKPIEWVKITMYLLNSLSTHPPVFAWRFSDRDEETYAKVKKCINAFEGNLKWIMYKGSELSNQARRNYGIEPMMFYEINKREGYGNLVRVLGSRYNEVCLKAIEDVPLLCKHIEQAFGLSNSKPYLPIYPYDKK